MSFRIRGSTQFILLLIFFLTIVSGVVADSDCAADPYADPANDPCNPLKYVPSNVLTALALVLYLLVALTQTFMIWKIGGRFMLTLIIAEFVFCLGFILRFAVRSNLHSRGLYIVEYLFIILAPCGFIAADYVLLGRLCLSLNGDKHLLIRPQRITLFFVASDIVTFIIQAGGGSLQVSDNPNTVRTGSRIFQVGLILQLISFIFYILVLGLFIRRIRTHESHIWNRDCKKPFFNDWRALALALAVSCIGILIRSIYRTIEAIQGHDGKLATTEGYFYGLDTLPLFVAVVAFVPFWPGRFIPDSEEEMKRLRSWDASLGDGSTIAMNTTR